MSDCILNTSKAIWSFSLGSFRLILFLSCLLFALEQMLCMLFVLKAHQLFGSSLPQSLIGLNVHIQLLTLFTLAAFGCFAAFYKKRSSLIAFSTLAGFAALLLLLVVYLNFSVAARARTNVEFSQRMANYSKLYDWKMDDNNSSALKRTSDQVSVEEASQAWDLLQGNLFCCGLQGPEDWKAFRPNQVSKNLFPISCCSSEFNSVNHTLPLPCTSDRTEFVQTGCLDRVERLELIYQTMYGVFVGTLLIQGMFAFLVGSFSLKRHHRASTRKLSLT